MGEEDLLRSHGVEVEVLQDGTCISLTRSFIAEKPGLWDDDIGQVSGLNELPGAE